MKTIELLKEIETGWYVEEIVRRNIDKLGSYITGDSFASKMDLTKIVRESFFANKECNELAKMIHDNEHGNLESFRICEAVFAESIASRKYPVLKLVLSKIHTECKGLSVSEIEEYLAHQVMDLDGGTVQQLATRPVLKKDQVAGGRNVCVK
ncbi:hypothetical protein [Vagococcus fluvialis]|uniref:hypothetical protein n=1 Tax=Vagococcus fluvialis TaxID=2738 RepID=UPI001D0A2F20|nr:hypothetical protein [Vagococcus fluvialis]UDM72661.1 hypothetical protein K5L00_14835 [Vagococcus fluvialis]UDM78384.1 hypothetical protein K5K98_15040 [Vagococcus fluvialis]UDM83936.1 hypothetical protein K5K96_14860 [Vagococcus fluvialis]